jgi:glycosyltransferase involved in cell wall biosynthesis
MPRLSIITINLNNASGLGKTIESVIDQTFSDFEYIIIDGGSTDGSMDVIREFFGKITYWISEPDGGIYNAMNKGILRAKGEYLHFLNSGDWLKDNNVYNDIFRGNPNKDVVYGNLIKVYPDGACITDKGIQGKDITLFTMLNGNLNHPSSFIRKELFEKNGLYDENYKIVSDWKFFLQIFGINSASAQYIDRDICYFDMTGIGIVQKENLFNERQKVLEKLVPSPILSDYEKYGKEITWIYMIKENRLASLLFRITKKVLIWTQRADNKRHWKFFL